MASSRCTQEELRAEIQALRQELRSEVDASRRCKEHADGLAVDLEREQVWCLSIFEIDILQVDFFESAREKVCTFVQVLT